MKIHAVVRAYEVENRTREGWTLVQAMPASNYEKVFCDTPIPSDDSNSGRYGAATSQQREELVQVHEPIFLIAKELEGIDREEQLKVELRAAQDKLKLAEEKHKLDERDIRSLTADRDHHKTQLSTVNTSLNDEQTTRRKLEVDLGKIRSAIGTVRYGEILSG